MTDGVRFPAADVAALYHRRWETEMVVDDLKTEQRGARMTLRSKTPDGIHREILALMLAQDAALRLAVSVRRGTRRRKLRNHR